MSLLGGFVIMLKLKFSGFAFFNRGDFVFEEEHTLSCCISLSLEPALIKYSKRSNPVTEIEFLFKFNIKIQFVLGLIGHS